MSLRLLPLVGLLLATQTVSAARLVSGPMAGPPDLRAVTLWLQADAAAQVQVEYWPLGAKAKPARSKAWPLAADTQFTAQVELTGLQPGTRYAYRLLFNGKPASDTFQFATQQLWHWRTNAPDFTLLAGSCSYINEPAVDRPGRPYGDRHDIYAKMAAQQPDLTLWLGDNVYFREVDWNRRSGMEARWAYERQQPFLQQLLRTGGHAATWDDHDYGPDNANRSFPLKQDALDLHKRYWANPSYGLPDQPGVFTQFSFNDADIFLLDNRWNLDHPDLPAADKQMFGPAQMRWLKNALLNSTARFKLIAGGSQMLNKGRGDSWADYPAERDDFLKFLADTKIGGVIFLSGDVHRSELTRVEREGGLYPLHDLTCSPMSAGVYVREEIRERPNLVPGTVVMGMRNFCKLRFEGPLAERRLTMEVINADGQSQWTHTLSAAEIGAPWPTARHPALPRVAQ